MAVIGHFKYGGEQAYPGKIVFKNDDGVQVAIYLELDRNGEQSVKSAKELFDKIKSIKDTPPHNAYFIEVEHSNIISLVDRGFLNPSKLSGNKNEAVDCAKEIFNSLAKNVEGLGLQEKTLDQYYSI